jgi:type II secretory pathway pseudopilin PulG
MPNRFRLKHVRRKRTIAGLVVGGMVLIGLVVGSFYITLQQERGLTVFAPTNAADEDESSETEDVTTDREMADFFEPAAELSIDEQERKDEQRQNDLSEIHEALQQHYQEHGRYPTLTQMNSVQFRDANFPSLTKEVFQDPADTDSRVVITRTPQKATYAYDVVDEDGYTCEPSGRTCVSYTLSALLSGGLTYSIDSND